MSTAPLTNTCPACGAQESLDALIQRMIEDDQVRRLIVSVLTMSLPLGSELVQYLRLHKPAHQKLRIKKLHKLLAELVPDIQRTAIERNGRTWLVGLEAWRAALQAVFVARDKGVLTLPLDGNGYLYATLMRMASQQEAVQEREAEANRRHGAIPSSVTVNGVPMSIGAALEQVYGERDPALAKLDADAKAAVPIPDDVRAQLAKLRHGGAAP